ncbi:unnamed protein product [Orchesella dallaii]|uniref:Protein kinase domain-containing protein n=1 Tax=Orchesella dallaii TaxID=48710 RepID=A0ABP1S6V3_9HEXA
MENLRYESRSFLIGYVIYKFYISFVIRIYIHDILYEAQSKSGYRDLFDHEITQFENGTERCTSSVNDVIDEGSDIENHLYQRYKREKFEIPMENLDFDDATQIGCGAYGCVYKLNYNIKTNGMRTAMTVAVKTVDPDLSDVTYFLTLLAEAKLMTYLGKHKHIVELIGVCTSKIRERKLYIVCELCSFGNLQMYLRSERSRFVPLPLPEYLERIERQIVQPATCDLQNVNTCDLIRWCYEIGLGMEFLESKKVPLPWRWLAVEVLVDMNLSTKSDVWSYGITCWEIFELGKRPWSNYQQYSLEYIHDIQNGARLDKPNNCYQEIYDEVIALCWKDEPSARPSFSNIASKLTSFLCEDVID